MAKTLPHELKSEVRIAEHKKQQVFDDIHVLEHEGLSNEEIIAQLTYKHYVYDISEAEAWLWLRKYKEHKMAEADEKHNAAMAKLSGEIEQINKTLAVMENR